MDTTMAVVTVAAAAGKLSLWNLYAVTRRTSNTCTFPGPFSYGGGGGYGGGGRYVILSNRESYQLV